MPRPLWKGAINFGLVHIPVRMYKTASAKDIRFRELHDADGVPLKQKRVCPADGKEVPYEHVVKGYEVAPDQFVLIERKELEALETHEGHTINIENFVKLEEIDPLYYEKTYYVVPEKTAARAYALLVSAMREAGKVALARVVLRAKQHLVILRPTENVLTLSTLFYADEVVSQDELEGLPEISRIDRRELTMATQLIDSLTSEFEPERYRDEYRERVLELIERKAKGENVRVKAARPQKAQVIDLMDALQASLKQAKGDEKPASTSKAKREKAKPAATRKRKAA